MKNLKYEYGTTADCKHESGDIKFVRKCAQRYFDGEKNTSGESTVYITQHAFKRSNERKILMDDAIETICKNFFVEFQPARWEGQDPRTLFYSNHETQIITVNTLEDIFNQKITLLTVEHKDLEIWRDKELYIERI